MKSRNIVDIVVGLGETGKPLFDILNKRHGTIGYDQKTGIVGDITEFEAIDYLNICIPYSETFVETVKEYQARFKPILTIIHSTVPIGTTSKFENSVHSPVLGKHGNMEKSIREFTKWVGGDLANEAAMYLEEAGLNVRTVETAEETEALKLLCLAKYGMSIIFADYCKEVADAVGFSYDDILDWDTNYNNHVAQHLRRPLLTAPDGVLGGHCVLQNSTHLNSFKPNKIVQEIMKYKGEV